MRLGQWAAHVARLREAAEDDVIHVRVLAELDVPESTVYRRCGDDGPWTLMAPSTIRLGTGTATRRQLARAALVYAGAGAMLTGLDGARAHRLRRGELPDDVHVLIEASRRVRSVEGIRVERTHRPPSPWTRDGLTVAPMERCVIDAVRGMSDRGNVAAVLTEPVQRRMLLVDSLRVELEAGPRAGSGLPRRVLQAVAAGARSAAEVDFRLFRNQSAAEGVTGPGAGVVSLR